MVTSRSGDLSSHGSIRNLSDGFKEGFPTCSLAGITALQNKVDAKTASYQEDVSKK